jgi:hypothetical protein
MNTKTRQWLVPGLAAVVAVTAFVKAWFTAHAVSVGLWGIEVCDHGCQSIRWDNVPGAQDDLYIAGYLAFAAAIVGAATSIVPVFATAVTKVGGRALRIARISLAIAFLAMLYFITRAIALDGMNGVSISWALPICPAATIALRQVLPRPS